MKDLLGLVDEMTAWLVKLQFESSPPINHPDPGRKWEYRSALQKAVRRGQLADAIKLSKALHMVDSDYLWRGLAVIAVEDVGPMAPRMVLYTTAMTTKTVRQKFNQTRMLEALVRGLCLSVKSRSCCEMSIAVDWGHPELFKSLGDLPDKELLDHAGSTEVPVSYAALCVIRGKAPLGLTPGARPKAVRRAAEDILRSIVGKDPIHQEAVVHAFRRPVDSMSVAMGPAMRLLMEQESVITDPETQQWPVSQRLHGLNSEAYDMHTQKGKLALKAFYTTMVKSSPWLSEISPQKASKAIGAVVFVEEGGMVDSRVTSPQLQTLKEAQDRTLITTYGVPEDLVQVTRTLVRENIGKLNSKRGWACQLDH